MIFAMKMQYSCPFAYVVSAQGPAALANGDTDERTLRTRRERKPVAMIAFVLFIFN